MKKLRHLCAQRLFVKFSGTALLPHHIANIPSKCSRFIRFAPGSSTAAPNWLGSVATGSSCSADGRSERSVRRGITSRQRASRVRSCGFLVSFMASRSLVRHTGPHHLLISVFVFVIKTFQKRLIAFFNAFMPFLPQIPDPFVLLSPFL
jgi:hypothetical protein